MADFEPITLEELRGLGRRIDTHMIIAKASQEALCSGFTGPEEEMYGKMNELGEGWCTLCGPTLHNGELIILMVRPRQDEEDGQ